MVFLNLSQTPNNEQLQKAHELLEGLGLKGDLKGNFFAKGVQVSILETKIQLQTDDKQEGLRQRLLDGLAEIYHPVSYTSVTAASRPKDERDYRFGKLPYKEF